MQTLQLSKNFKMIGSACWQYHWHTISLREQTSPQLRTQLKLWPYHCLASWQHVQVKVARERAGLMCSTRLWLRGQCMWHFMLACFLLTLHVCVYHPGLKTTLPCIVSR
jgi:hypothetical protein